MNRGTGDFFEAEDKQHLSVAHMNTSVSGGERQRWKNTDKKKKENQRTSDAMFQHYGPQSSYKSLTL